jgi:iron(III) transport system ATP-binding protein
MMSMAAGITIAALSKSFGDNDVLTGLDLVIAPGSFTAVLGPSGCGKTTLLRVLAGLERPTTGRVEIGGVAVDDGRLHVPPEDRGIGYVPQEASLFPHLSVAQNVAFGVRGRQRRRAAVGRLLQTVGLEGYERRFPHELSGGQQQRVALARALAIDPSVVLLDEPFAALDDRLRTELREAVKAILRQVNATTILVTHDQDEALSLADHVAVVRAGRVAQMSSPRALYLQPNDEEIAGLVGDANLVAGVADGACVTTALGTVELRHGAGLTRGTPVTVVIRPEQLEVRGGHLEGCTHGVVESSWFHGHDALVRIECAALADARCLLARSAGDRGFDPGDPISLRVVGPVWAWPRGDDPSRAAAQQVPLAAQRRAQ